MPHSRPRPWQVNFAPGEDSACYAHAFPSPTAKFQDRGLAGALRTATDMTRD